MSIDKLRTERQRIREDFFNAPTLKRMFQLEEVIDHLTKLIVMKELGN